MQIIREMIQQKSQSCMNGCVLDHMVVIENQDNFITDVDQVIDQQGWDGFVCDGLRTLKQRQCRLANLKLDRLEA